MSGTASAPGRSAPPGDRDASRMSWDQLVVGLHPSPVGRLSGRILESAAWRSIDSVPATTRASTLACWLPAAVERAALPDQCRGHVIEVEAIGCPRRMPTPTAAAKAEPRVRRPATPFGIAAYPARTFGSASRSPGRVQPPDGLRTGPVARFQRQRRQSGPDTPPGSCDKSDRGASCLRTSPTPGSTSLEFGQPACREFRAQRKTPRTPISRRRPARSRSAKMARTTPRETSTPALLATASQHLHRAEVGQGEPGQPPRPAFSLHPVRILRAQACA